MLPSAFLFVYYNKYNCGGIGNKIFSCLAGPNLMSSYYCKFYGVRRLQYTISYY